MKFFREENIKALCESMVNDKFEELSQYDNEAEFDPAYEPILMFVHRNIKSGRVLDVGCGSGASFNIFPDLTDAIEPNHERYIIAKKRGEEGVPSVDVVQGFVEALPFKDHAFSTILMINTWGHVRSDFEALIEINRKLKSGGHFIFNISGDELDIYAGRAGYAPRNWRRILRDFGFEIVEYREIKYTSGRKSGAKVSDHCVCVSKEEEFNPENLRKMQIVEVTTGLYKINNFFPDGRDWRLK